VRLSCFATPTIACCIALAGLVPVSAQGTPSGPGHFGFTMYGTAAFGGDTVGVVGFKDGSTQNINAGQGLDFGLGGHYKIDRLPVDISATLGYKYVTTQATNANINLSRTVLELRADYLFPNHAWVGLGSVWHSNIKLNSDGYAPNLAFDDAQGVTVKVGWHWVALAYTNMKYRDEFGFNFDASNFGITLVGRW